MAFAKLCGYVKYFHPSDEGSKIDRDKFTVYGARETEKCTNNAELKNFLEKLFLPITPAMQMFPQN